MTLEKIGELMKCYAEKDTQIIIGVSGGVDSVVLLSLLFELKYTKVLVAHVNHMYRDTANLDAVFVSELASSMGYEYKEKKCDIKQLSLDTKDSIENCGRKVRYTFFEELRESNKATLILTAHHTDDLLESRMMHLLRGSSLRGLEGMKPFDAKRHLLRPLLTIKKKELIEYAQMKRLDWREDCTNDDTLFVRNKIRHEVLPACYGVNPAFDEVMNRLAQNAHDMENFLSEELSRRIGEMSQTEYEYQSLATLPKILLNEFFAQLLREKDPSFTLTTAHIDNIRIQFAYLQSGKSIYLTPRLQCTRSFDMVYIHGILEKEINTSQSQEYSSLPENFSYNGYRCTLSDTISSFQILQESLSQGITLRLPQPGDKVLIVHKEKEFHKPLKKYFIEQKIPVDLRHTIPVMIAKSTGEVIALLGRQSLVHGTQKPCIYLNCEHGHL